jgi:hypothetical protein
MSRIVLAAPTVLEHLALRFVMPRAGAVRIGVGLAHWREQAPGGLVVVCGLAGALDKEVEPGTIVIPDRLGLPDGRFFPVDPQVADALVTAARRLGFPVHGGSLLTAPSLIVGQERRAWAHKGFVAADMEAALLAARGYRVATIRAVLDGPKQEISQEWRRPATAMLQPRLWTELFRLGRTAPQYALRAARVLKAGLQTLPSTMSI